MSGRLEIMRVMPSRVAGRAALTGIVACRPTPPSLPPAP